MAFGVNEALKRAFPDDPATKAQGGPPNLSKPFVMVRRLENEGMNESCSL